MEHPPTIGADRGLQRFDIFIHAYSQTQYQAWRCETINPIRWTPLVEGRAYKLPGQARQRTFVITEGGQPSWVLPDTVGRAYKKFKHFARQDGELDDDCTLPHSS